MSTQQNAVFEVKSLSKTYSGIKALDNVSFTIQEGEVHALVGENGAGKSTLIKIIAGVQVPDKGSEIYYEGKLVKHITAASAMEMGLSVIYQDISLFPNLTVAENICMPINKNAFIDWRDMAKIAAAQLSELGADINLNTKLCMLKVGKQQLVAIARALACKARIIIMDEPTAALSSSEVDTLLEIVRKVRDAGVGIIYITHKLNEVFKIANYVSVLRDGQIVANDTIENFTNDRLIKCMVGRDLRFVPMHNEDGESSRIVFEAKDITYEPYFRNISFKVKEKEILGFTGLVGAGRSELAHAIFGIYKAQQGESYLSGDKLKIKEPKDAIKYGIAYLPEDRRTQSMFTGQNVTKNITIAALDKVLNKFNLIMKSLERKTAKEFVEKLQIKPPDRLLAEVESLSGGNQQKVMIARWLNTSPKLLIVDEPTSGIDVGAKLEIHKILRHLAKEGVGIILISSDLPEVIALSDRIIVMRKGDLVTEMSSMEATQEAIMERGLLG